jgi:hypothetical protein
MLFLGAISKLIKKIRGKQRVGTEKFSNIMEDLTNRLEGHPDEMTKDELKEMRSLYNTIFPTIFKIPEQLATYRNMYLGMQGLIITAFGLYITHKIDAWKHLSMSEKLLATFMADTIILVQNYIWFVVIRAIFEQAVMYLELAKSYERFQKGKALIKLSEAFKAADRLTVVPLYQIIYIGIVPAILVSIFLNCI